MAWNLVPRCAYFDLLSLSCWKSSTRWNIMNIKLVWQDTCNLFWPWNSIEWGWWTQLAQPENWKIFLIFKESTDWLDAVHLHSALTSEMENGKYCSIFRTHFTNPFSNCYTNSVAVIADNIFEKNPFTTTSHTWMKLIILWKSSVSKWMLTGHNFSPSQYEMHGNGPNPSQTPPQ